MNIYESDSLADFEDVKLWCNTFGTNCVGFEDTNSDTYRLFLTSQINGDVYDYEYDWTLISTCDSNVVNNCGTIDSYLPINDAYCWKGSSNYFDL